MTRESDGPTTEGSLQYQTARWGPLLIQCKLDEDFVEELLEKGLESRHSGKKQLDARRYLAGNIENEFTYENIEDWLVPKMKPYINAYVELVDQWTGDNAFKHLMSNSSFENIMKGGLDPKVEIEIAWYMTMAWINFQKKGEYNPPHNHPCDLSFVAFLQVPKEIGEEHEALKDGDNGSWRPGTIFFNYGEQLPFSVKSLGKYPERGDLFLFPGWLMHHVHDFKSDVERISVSGNVMFDIKIKDRINLLTDKKYLRY